MGDRGTHIGRLVVWCFCGALLGATTQVQSQGCQPAAPAITIEDIYIVKAGQVVATYKDNAFFNPYYHDYVGVHFKGWTPCTDGGAWARGPNNAEVDGAVVDSIAIGGGLGCSGQLQYAAVFDQFGPPWIQLVTEMGPGAHTIQLTGYPANYGSSNCNGVFVRSNSVTVWVSDSNGNYGNEPDSCDAAKVGRPVNLASGKMDTEMVDLTIQGPIPIEFRRHFDSKSTYDGAMGYGWQHSFMSRLELGFQPAKTLVDDHARRIAFNCAVGTQGSPFGQCQGTWHENSYDHLSLIQGSDPPWQVADKHGKKWDFDASGRLTRITDRNNNWVSISYNGADTLVADQFGRGLTITTIGGRVDHITAGDRVVRYTYDNAAGSAGNLLEVWSSDPNTTEHTVASYAYDAGTHRLRTVTDANGHLVESHDYESGRVTHTQSDGGNYSYTINYDDPLQPTVINGRSPAVTTTYTLAPLTGLALGRDGGPGCSSCGDAGNSNVQVYDDHWNKTDVTDGEGVTTHMTYDGMGNVLTRTEAYATAACNRDNTQPCEPETCYPATCAPRLERKTTYTYDDYSLPTSITIPTLGTETCASDHGGNKVVTLGRDPKGNLTREETTGCNGNQSIDLITTYSYACNGRGQVCTVDGPRDDVSDVTNYVYYEATEFPAPDPSNVGRLKQIIDAIGHPTTFNSYDYFGNVLSVTDMNDVETSYEYNIRDQVTEKRIHVGNPADEDDDIVTKFVYDSVGNLQFLRLPNCVAVDCDFSYKYVYDGVNRVKEVHDALGNKAIYTYDAEGNRTREEYRQSTGLLRKFTNFWYDDFNRLMSIRFEPPPHPPYFPPPIAYWFGYFEDGTRLSESDPLHHATTFTYDDLKRLETSTQTVGSNTLTTTYKYDVQDNLKSVRDPKGVITTYTYGDQGLRLSTVSPDAGTTTYDYDKAGNLVTTSDALNASVREYDRLNRLTYATFVNHIQTSIMFFAYSYDSPYVTFGIGRRTGMEDASGITDFDYDPRGFLKRETKSTIAYMTVVTGYDYDLNGNLTQIQYPSISPGPRAGFVNYEYDEADRVSLVDTGIGGQPTNVASEFAYMPFGPRSSMKLANTLVDTRSYDSRYQILDWTLGNLLSYTHVFNKDGNLTSLVDRKNSLNNRTLAYDEGHRLTFAEGPWGPGDACSGVTYTYDDNGNRLCKGETPTSTTYVYTPNTNRLESSTTGDVETSYEYDSNGNTTEDGSHDYSYDVTNRLGGVDQYDTAGYLYDGEHRQAVKVTPQNMTLYFYDPAGRLLTEMTLGEVTGTGDGKDYLYLPEGPVARVDWSIAQVPAPCWPGAPTNDCFTFAAYDTLFYYHTDHLGTPIAMTDGDGAPVWKAELRPFGDVEDVSYTTLTNNLRFPGQYFDAETGLHQNWFRDYDPKTGRYLESDPIGLQGGSNTYAYSTQSPANVIDPVGLTPTQGALQRWWQFNFGWGSGIFHDWWYGVGDEHRVYGPNDPQTAEFRQGPAAEQMRQYFIRHGCKSFSPRPGHEFVGYGTREAFEDLFADPANATASQVGGFSYNFRVNSNRTVTFHVHNRLDPYSFFLHFPGVTDDLPRNTGWSNGLLPDWIPTPMGNVYQDFIWREALPCECK